MALRATRAADASIRFTGIDSVGALFFNRPVDDAEKMRTDIHAVENRAVACRVHTVCEENENQILCRVDPEHRACIAEMSHHSSRSLLASRGIVGIVDVGLVEAQTATACRAFVGEEKLSRFGRMIRASP